MERGNFNLFSISIITNLEMYLTLKFEKFTPSKNCPLKHYHIKTQPAEHNLKLHHQSSIHIS